MVEYREITKEEFNNTVQSINYFEACMNLAKKIAINTIWNPIKYGVYAAEVLYRNDKYYISWAHKSYKNQLMPYTEELI